MPVLEALGETCVEPHVVCFGVALLKGVSRRQLGGTPRSGGAGLPALPAALRLPEQPVPAAEPHAPCGQAGGGVFFSCAAAALSCPSCGSVLCAFCVQGLCAPWSSVTTAVCVCGPCCLSAACQVSFSSSVYSSCTSSTSCSSTL